MAKSPFILQKQNQERKSNHEGTKFGKREKSPGFYIIPSSFVFSSFRVFVIELGFGFGLFSHFPLFPETGTQLPVPLFLLSPFNPRTRNTEDRRQKKNQEKKATTNARNLENAKKARVFI